MSESLPEGAFRKLKEAYDSDDDPSLRNLEGIGQIAVARGFITEGQLEEALAEHREVNAGVPSPALGQILIRKQYLTAAQLMKLLQSQGRARLRCPRCGMDGTGLNVAGQDLACPECRRSSPVESWAVRSRPEFGPGVSFGRYRIESEVGRGGMSIVYRAQDLSLDRPVALKILSEETSKMSIVRRLYREGSTLAQLSHPGVVRVYEIGIFEGVHFLTMEFVDGEALSARQIHRPLTLNESVDIVRRVSEAVGFAHAQGIIHRDLKPSNVMLDRDGRVLVTDFGLARNLTSETRLTAEGTILGTPAYMAPEVMRVGAEEATRRSDVFSLGVMLYELATHRLPFPGSTVFEITQSLMKGEPLPPRHHRPEIPRELESILLKSIDLQPRRRYPDAGELADDLSRWQRGEAIQARTGGFGSRFLRRVRRRWRVLTVALLLVSTGLFAYSQSIRARRAGKEAYEARLQATVWKATVELTALDSKLRTEETDLLAEMERIAPIERELKSLLQEREHAEAYEVLGKLYFSLGRVDDAIAAWQGALRLNPTRTECRSRLAEAYVRRYEQDLSNAAPIEDPEERGRQEREAERWLRAAVATIPQDEYGRALVAYAQGDPELAERLARKSHDERRADARAYFLLGEIARKRRRWDEAMDWLARAAEGDRSDWMALVKGAEVRISKAERDDPPSATLLTEAIELCDRAERVKRDEGATYASRSHARMHLAEASAENALELFEKAVQDGRRAAELSPEEPLSHEFVGLAYLKWGQSQAKGGQDPRKAYRAAMDALTRCVSLYPKYAKGRNGLGVTNWCLGDWEQRTGGNPESSYRAAVEFHQQALRMSPESSAIRTHLAMAYGALGVWKASRGEDPTSLYAAGAETAQEAIRRNPDLPQTYEHLAATHLAWGKWEGDHQRDPSSHYQESIRTSHQLLAKDPQRTAEFRRIGLAWMGLGQWSAGHDQDPKEAYLQSLQALQNALRATEDKGIRLHLGRVRIKLGDCERKSGKDAGEFYRAALTDFDTVIARNASGWQGHYERGIILTRLHRWKEAVTALEEALRLQPQDSMIRSQLEKARRQLPP